MAAGSGLAVGLGVAAAADAAVLDAGLAAGATLGGLDASAEGGVEAACPPHPTTTIATSAARTVARFAIGTSLRPGAPPGATVGPARFRDEALRYRGHVTRPSQSRHALPHAHVRRAARVR